MVEFDNDQTVTLNTTSVGTHDKGNTTDFLNAIGEKYKSLKHQLRLKLKTRRALLQTPNCQHGWSRELILKRFKPLLGWKVLNIDTVDA